MAASPVDSARIGAQIPAPVRQLCRTLAEGGYRGWVVGGSLRDVLTRELGGERPDVADWDLATDARPEEVQRLFRRVIPTGLQHGTVTVLLDGEGYEVTTLRGETTYTDGRRPDAVYFVDDIADDLARRDFTVNAIAFDPLAERLIDPFDGLGDLRRKVLRAVGDPGARFGEDGLRVLRAARFVATLELDLEPATAAAIEPSLGSFRKVSPERVRDEWLKAMKARVPSRAFETMRIHGILGITAPELMESVGCEQNRWHAYDVWGHALACLDACPAQPVLRMAGLLHDVGKPRSRQFSDKTNDFTFYEHERIGAEMVAPMLARLRFSNDEQKRIADLVRHHLICYEDTWSDGAVRRWVQRVSPELLDDLYALNRADVLGKGRDASADLTRLAALRERVAQLMAAGAALGIRDLAIDGHALMQELGLAPGRILGEILRALLEQVIEDPTANERATLLARARALVAARHDG